jgi:hypothetical protein
MPFVHGSLRKYLVEPWDADVFFVYHEAYKAGSMARQQHHREGASACDFDPASLEAMKPYLKMVHKYAKPDNCTVTGSQWRQVRTCFDMALRYGKHHGKNYTIYARTRPDYALFDYVYDAETVSRDGIDATVKKSDIFFAMRPETLRHFLHAGDTHVPCDDPRCCLEMREPFHRGGESHTVSRTPELKGGLVRNDHWMTTWPADGWYKRPFTKEELDAGLKCDLVHRPAYDTLRAGCIGAWCRRGR